MKRATKLPTPNARPASRIPLPCASSASAGALLGVVYAPDEAAAIEAAVQEFGITDDQRRRLVLSRD